MGEKDDIDDAIRQIASKNGVAVGRDDPILVLLTINQLLQEKADAAQQSLLAQHKEELESIAQQWGRDAKEKAERILTAALSSSKEAMALAMNESATAAAGAVRAEIQTMSQKFAGAIENARHVATMNLVAGGLTIASAVIVLWSVLRH
ncbi:conjugal transfer protein TraM (plasmid) [Variovorax sp. SRS16]|uniref:conjugal transfer protein TraM n=1 Tax=Variovorax sp. SRS16 TaxID=282217 RepID=UPI001315E406|nr:conjugal transfer protein TraM [Variovorax sp. SRS16]VTU46107.1 conjugal transfer protein TraM [Variovorax sp. SRS16]